MHEGMLFCSKQPVAPPSSKNEEEEEEEGEQPLQVAGFNTLLDVAKPRPI